MKYGNEFGSRLRKLRENAGMSQIDLAIKMNVSDKTVSSWENGTRNPKDIIGIANAIGVSVDVLLGENSSTKVTKNTGAVGRYSIAGGKLVDYGENQVVTVQCCDGFFTLTCNGKRGEFMDIYTGLRQENKMLVLQAMIGELDSDKIKELYSFFDTTINDR